jgi:hypothetical protein
VNPYPYQRLTDEQLRVRARLFIQEGEEMLAEIDRRAGIAQPSREGPPGSAGRRRWPVVSDGDGDSHDEALDRLEASNRSAKAPADPCVLPRKRRAGSLKLLLTAVVRLQNRLARLEIDLQHPREVERNLANDRQDRRAVRFDPD